MKGQNMAGECIAFPNVSFTPFIINSRAQKDKCMKV